MKEKRAGDLKEGDRVNSREGVLRVARVDAYPEENEVVLVFRVESDNAPRRFECSVDAMIPLADD